MFVKSHLLVAMHKQRVLCIVGLLFFVSNCLLGQAYEKLPYFEGFEDNPTANGWELNVGPNGATAVNKWYISDAETFVGDSALYISADGGKTLSYKNNSIYNVACKEIYLPKGTYDLSFTWKCEGEMGADGLYVCWVPNTNALNIVSSSGSKPGWMLNRELVFDGVDFLCGSKEWKTSTTTITQQSTTPHKLVFVWTNNASTDNLSLSIVIDNVQIAARGCGKPENVKVSALSSDINVRWDGGATGYELMYKRYGESEVHSVKGINQTSYTIKGVQEGVYDIFVRSCCPDDTSIWVVQNNVLVYDAAAHCIDFINWDREGTTFETGIHKPKGEFIGDKFSPNIEPGSIRTEVVDNGYNSDESRHTKHYMPGEKDPNTKNELPTVPEGEVVSVRLGNEKTGGQFERVTYTHQLDSGSNMILLLKYAVVIQEPIDNPHDRTSLPMFTLELLDEDDDPLDPRGCGDANFVAKAKELIDNPNADGTWHVVKGGGDADILWKEWTTVGINVSQYAKYGPLKYKIRLTTYDCADGGHYGYAYYTLSCASATIEGLSCGENAGANINAPEGFNYRWYRVRDNKTVCTTRNLQGIEKNDTALYRCEVMFAQDPTCYFELDASLLPKLPKAQFSPKWMPRDCDKNNVKFQNTSHVTTERGPTGEKCETHRWYLKEGENWEKIHEGDSLEWRFPNGGGQFDVRLEVGMSNDECIDDTIITVNVPKLGAIEDTIYDTICEGKSLKVEGRRYMQEGIYRVYRGISFGGCDSTVFLNLKVTPKERDTISEYLCGKETYILNGQEFSRSGVYRTVYKANEECECDTVVTLFLNIAELSIAESLTMCSGDSLVLNYDPGETVFDAFEIIFNDAAKSAGLKDVSRRALPEKRGVISFGLSEISDEKEDKNPITPGYYEMTVIFYYKDENGVERRCENLMNLDVLYSTETIEQKFDNVMTLFDKDFNGGYEFDYVQWYKNGEPMEGENNTYLYLEDVIISSSDLYSVGLIRKGESEEVMSCPVSFQVGTPVENVEMLGVHVVSNKIKIGNHAVVVFDEGYDECVVRWWSVAGVLLAEEAIVGDGYLSSTPQKQGVYVLELVVGEERVVERIVVE